MRFSVRVLWVAGLIVALALVAVACGDGDEGPTPTDETPGATEPETTELETDFGVTDTEIHLGMTLAQSGNPSAAAYSAIASAIQAAFAKINEEDGGVCNRQIRLTLEDDQYDPAISLQQATKLALQDQVLAFVGNLGTPPVTGHVDFVNDPNGDGDTSDGIPHLYLSTGASKWNNPEQWPWTIGYIPDYVSEGKILAGVVNEKFSGQTAAILYQNDDFGQDGREGFVGVFEGQVVAEQSYEAGATEVTSQLANLRDADPDILYVYSLPLTTAAVFRYMEANNWRPQVVTSYVNPNTLMAVLVGGGAEPAQVAAGNQQLAGTILTNYLLDPVTSADDPAYLEHVRIMETYGGPDPSQLTVYGDSLARLAAETLQIACDNGDMTRAGVLAAAQSIQGYTSELYLEAIEVNLSPTDHFAIQGLIPVAVQEDGALEAIGEYTDVSEQ